MFRRRASRSQWRSAVCPVHARRALKRHGVQDRVVIRVAEGETSSSGGVILTSQSAEKPTIGEVVAVGPGKKGEDGKVTAVNCKPGEQVRGRALRRAFLPCDALWHARLGRCSRAQHRGG